LSQTTGAIEMKIRLLIILSIFLLFPCPAYSQDKEESGRILLEAAKQSANIYEDGDFLVVEMYEYINDKNLLFRYITNIANADAAVNHRARHIFFYDPSKNKIGEADKINGIWLIEK
jgi:hypothetical protein